MHIECEMNAEARALSPGVLGRARLEVGTALWSHACVIVVVVMEDPPPHWLADTPLADHPPTTTPSHCTVTCSRDGW